MNVALVAPSVRGAMGQYIEALAGSLGTRVQLALFVPNHFDGCVANVQVRRFLTGHSRRAAMLRLINPRGAKDVWGHILNWRPHVVHLFNGEGYPWSLWWSRWAAKAGIPLVVTVHDPEPHPGNVWEAGSARLRPHVLRRATVVHVHSEVFSSVARAQGSREVTVIPHGSLAPRFVRYWEPGIRREPLVLFFGRIEHYKGIDLLAEAGFKLRSRMRVAIAGPGRIPHRLLHSLLRHQDVFELHNRYLSDAEVARLFQRASVCVLPYRQATQSSIPLIAAAFGVPVVASRVGSFVEDVPRVNGLLVPPEDPEALAEGIMAALSVVPRYPKEMEFPFLADQFVEMYRKAVNKLGSSK